MAFYISPLVDVKEVDLSTTITAASTSIGVSIIRNPKKGPELKKILITNDDELVRVFGTPTNNRHNYIDMLSTVGALKYMSTMYCTAVKPEDATFAGLSSSETTSVDLSGNTIIETTFSPLVSAGGSEIKLKDFMSLDPNEFHNEVTPIGAIDFIAASRGKWGNDIRIAVVTSNIYDKLIRKEQSISEYSYSQILKSIDQPIDKDDNMSFLILVQLLQENKNPLQDSNWDIVEVWNVSTDEKGLDEQGRTKFAETIINSSSQYIRIAFNELQKNKDLTIDMKDWARFGGGDDGSETSISDSLIMEALDLYSNPEEIDVNIFIDSDKSETVKSYINEICKSRKDCMGIFDCKYEHVVNNKGSETTSIVTWRKGLEPYTLNNLNINSDKVALYSNWGEVYDRWNQKYRWIPLSGHVAGVYAYTDYVNDPWFAPAGLNRALLDGIRRLAWNPNQAQRDELYKNGINPIVSFAGQGKVIWGQKTMLDKTSAFNRVNVRRLFITIEKALATYAKYYIFEQNDEYTRYQLRSSIEPFLRDVRARRGIYDFEVICDERNNTPERIDRNELWCDILVKATRTAEFIILRFTATKTDASFSEIMGILESGS